MKLKLALLALVAASSAAFGATINVTNIAGDFVSSRPFFDNSGAPLTGGTLILGAYTGGDPTLLTGAEIAANFTPFGNSLGTNANFPATTTPVAGGVNGAVNATGDALSGTSPVYVWVGNAGTIAGSSEGLLLQSDVAFPADTDPAALVDLIAGSFTQLLGSNDVSGDILFGGTPSGTVDNGYGLQTLVPEPSSTLLVGLGALGLLIRRKR